MSGVTHFLVLSPRRERPEARFAGNVGREFHLPPGVGRYESLAANFSEASEAGDN